MNDMKAYTHIAEQLDAETGKYALYAYDVNGNHTPVDETELVYLKSDADAAIAELKAKLENVQASAYAESVDAGMENHKLKRVLWLTRAKRTRDLRTLGNFRRYVESLVKTIPSIYHYPTKGFPSNQLHKRMMSAFETWCKYLKIAEDKCLKKAEKYK